MVIVGAGYIGLELGLAFAKLGSSVSVVEFADRILPQYDQELSSPILKKLKALGVELLLNAKAKSAGPSGNSLIVEKSNEEEVSIPADKILVTVGRKARLEGWGLAELQLSMNDRFVKVDQECRTSMLDVFAVGDVTGEPMLAHRAMAQGAVAAEVIAGEKRVFQPNGIVSVCFTDPEIVSVGVSPEDARSQGLDIVVGKFPLSANGRAMTMEANGGFVRVIARKDNGVVIGIQAVGHEVSEFSAAFALAIEMGCQLEDIAGTIHAHPTQSEAFQEAAMLALGRGLHM